MKKLNICIDIDGTITDPYHFIPYMNEMYNDNIKAEDCYTHRLEVLYNKSLEDILEKFHNEYSYCYKEADIVEGSHSIITKLHNEHNLYFVTARSEILEQHTLEWLIEKEFPKIDVHLLGSYYKVDKAKELNCNVFIEDNPDNALELAQEGIKVLLIETNYNKAISHENVIRVKNWYEISDIIKNLSL